MDKIKKETLKDNSLLIIGTMIFLLCCIFIVVSISQEASKEIKYNIRKQIEAKETLACYRAERAIIDKELQEAIKHYNTTGDFSWLHNISRDIEMRNQK